MFQSAPLTEARGDDRDGAMMWRIVVSIRSPHRSKGRRLFCHSWRGDTRYPVSIRSPHRSKGRHKAEDQPAFLAVFQSAPLTEARGDFFALVSIRSPHRSKGRRPIREIVSIRSPHRSKGRRRFTAHAGKGRQCRNPLPSPKQGETLVAITSGITKTYTGTCAIRSNSCQECPTRLPRNAITCCYAGSFQLRESKGKTPSLHFRARYKTSGSFKSTGSPTP